MKKIVSVMFALVSTAMICVADDCSQKVKGMIDNMTEEEIREIHRQTGSILYHNRDKKHHNRVIGQEHRFVKNEDGVDVRINDGYLNMVMRRWLLDVKNAGNGGIKSVVIEKNKVEIIFIDGNRKVYEPNFNSRSRM